MKDCKKAKERFSEYFDELLEGSSKRELERHLANCPACRKAWNSYRSIFTAVRNLPPVEAYGDFEARLAARIRREEAPRRSWWQDFARIPLPIPIGAAALILAAVFSYTHRADRPAPSPGESPSRLLAADTAGTAAGADIAALAFQVQEIQALDYPFFVDVRPNGMAKNSPVVSNLPAITLNWASPITVDMTKNADRNVETLLSSTAGAWLQTDNNIQPNFDLYPDTGFPQFGDTGVYTLAVSAQGSFDSYFAGKPSPFETASNTEGATPPPTSAGTIETSPETARLLVVGSAEFLDDIVFKISSSLTRDRYLNSLQFVKNAVAWATEDLDLLSIQARGTTARVLKPLAETEESFWEIVNYVAALVALLVLSGVTTMRRRNEQPLPLIPPDGGTPGVTDVQTAEVKA